MAMKKCILAALAASAAATCATAQLVTIVPDADVATMEKTIAGAYPAESREAKTPLNVLVFFKCEGFCHNNAISYGLKAFEILSRKTGANVSVTADYKYMNAKTFSKFDVIVLMNCTHPDTKNNKKLESDLIDFVKSGKGLCVIHAGCDGFYEAPGVADMIGGQFWDHPWYFGGPWSIKNEDPGNPINRAFASEGETFKRKEEIYQHSTPPYDPSKVHVLLSLDMKDAATAKRFAEYKGKCRRTDGQFPVSWTKQYGGGRVFYTTFGHEKNAFTDASRLVHILDGMFWTAGAGAKPSTPQPSPTK